MGVIFQAWTSGRCSSLLYTICDTWVVFQVLVSGRHGSYPILYVTWVVFQVWVSGRHGFCPILYVTHEWCFRCWWVADMAPIPYCMWHTSGVSGVGEWQTWLLSCTVCDVLMVFQMKDVAVHCMWRVSGLPGVGEWQTWFAVHVMYNWFVKSSRCGWVTDMACSLCCVGKVGEWCFSSCAWQICMACEGVWGVVNGFPSHTVYYYLWGHFRCGFPSHTVYYLWGCFRCGFPSHTVY